MLVLEAQTRATVSKVSPASPPEKKSEVPLYISFLCLISPPTTTFLSKIEAKPDIHTSIYLMSISHLTSTTTFSRKIVSYMPVTHI